MSDEKKVVRFNLNGKPIIQKVSTSQMMTDFLHETMGLTGTKVCCGMGICKACTIAFKKDNESKFERAQACVTPVVYFQNCEVKTVEGLAENGSLSALQNAFLNHFSFQCGYSTPGFLMGAYILISELKQNPIPRSQVEEAIQNALGQHICRCTGYVKYHAAIREVVIGTPGLTRD